MSKLKPKRLTRDQLKEVGLKLYRRQGQKCVLCDSPVQPLHRCVDHDHKTGYIRDVLCRNCNGMEGKLLNIANRGKRRLSTLAWLKNVVAYYERHIKPRAISGTYVLIHPTHKTEQEKRDLRNKRRRVAYKKSKKGSKK